MLRNSSWQNIYHETAKYRIRNTTFTTNVVVGISIMDINYKNKKNDNKHILSFIQYINKNTLKK
jgi:hypothetical protein